MTILENNKLIAEFMGLTPENNIDTSDIQECVFELTPVERAKYRSSWDWLMPVVDKIESTVQGIGFEIRPTQCIIDEQYSNNSFLDENSLEYNFTEIFTVGKNRFEATYNAVIEFINWYNKINLK